MSEIMRIGECAKRAGCSISTLRNYERSGLLHPIRDPSGLRLYTKEHITQARHIYGKKKASRRVGTSKRG